MFATWCCFSISEIISCTCAFIWHYQYFNSLNIHFSKSKKKKKATTRTFAVATCPSVSSLSIVPVGKYGTIAVNDRANNLEEIEFNLKWTTFHQLRYILPIIWVPKVEFKLVLGCSKPTWEFYKWQKAAQTQLLVNGSSPKIWLQVRKEREKSQLWHACNICDSYYRFQNVC